MFTYVGVCTYMYTCKYVINYNYIMEMIWTTLIQYIRISLQSLQGLSVLQVVVESLNDVVDPGSSAANQHDANASTRKDGNGSTWVPPHGVPHISKNDPI